MAISKLSNNLIYSWWVNPIATREGGTCNTLYGGVMTDGSPRVFRHRGTEWEPSENENHVMFQGLEPDDHNAPSIVSREGKDLIVFWQRHGKSNFLNYWHAPEGTFNFGVKKAIEFPSTVTYSQSLVYGDKILTFVRVIGNQWYYVMSDDWGATWSAPIMFFNGYSPGQVYCNFQPFDGDDTRYHVTIYGHPTSSSWRDVIYGQIDMVTGDVNIYAGPVANLYSQVSLPITTTTLDVAWTPQGTSGEKVRMLDVSNKQGKNCILLAKWNDTTALPQYYIALQDCDGTWTNFKYFNSGGMFDDGVGRKYVYGMCFDKNNRNILYAALKEGGVYKVKQFKLDPSLELYDEKLLASNANKQLARPYAVYGKDAVIWQELVRYNTFADYESILWMYEDVC